MMNIISIASDENKFSSEKASSYKAGSYQKGHSGLKKDSESSENPFHNEIMLIKKQPYYESQKLAIDMAFHVHDMQILESGVCSRYAAISNTSVRYIHLISRKSPNALDMSISSLGRMCDAIQIRSIFSRKCRMLLQACISLIIFLLRDNFTNKNVVSRINDISRSMLSRLLFLKSPLGLGQFISKMPVAVAARLMLRPLRASNKSNTDYLNLAEISHFFSLSEQDKVVLVELLPYFTLLKKDIETIDEKLIQTATRDDVISLGFVYSLLTVQAVSEIESTIESIKEHSVESGKVADADIPLETHDESANPEGPAEPKELADLKEYDESRDKNGFSENVKEFDTEPSSNAINKVNLVLGILDRILSKGTSFHKCGVFITYLAILDQLHFILNELKLSESYDDKSFHSKSLSLMLKMDFVKSILNMVFIKFKEITEIVTKSTKGNYSTSLRSYQWYIISEHYLKELELFGIRNTDYLHNSFGSITNDSSFCLDNLVWFVNNLHDIALRDTFWVTQPLFHKVIMHIDRLIAVEKSSDKSSENLSEKEPSGTSSINAKDCFAIAEHISNVLIDLKMKYPIEVSNFVSILDSVCMDGYKDKIMSSPSSSSSSLSLDMGLSNARLLEHFLHEPALRKTYAECIAVIARCNNPAQWSEQIIKRVVNLVMSKPVYKVIPVP